MLHQKNVNLFGPICGSVIFFPFRRDTNFSCVENQRRLRSTINTRGLSAIRGSMDTLLHIFPRRRLLITSERLCVIKCHVNTALPCDNNKTAAVCWCRADYSKTFTVRWIGKDTNTRLIFEGSAYLVYHCAAHTSARSACTNTIFFS